jgi:hypothetical protein
MPKTVIQDHLQGTYRILGPRAETGFQEHLAGGKEGAMIGRRSILPVLIMVGLLLLPVLGACTGDEGPQGPAGPAGPAGPGLTDEQEATLEDAASFADGIPWPALDEVLRGCPACHVLVDPETGQFTLPYEAHERSEARDGEHPGVAPDGTPIGPTDEAGVETCLLCHAPGTEAREGKGVIAPLSLRDIVHPAHMSSQWFKLHYGGGCFTCHNVDGEAEFEVLTEKVDVNEKGVPNPDDVPIPGAIEVH